MKIDIFPLDEDYIFGRLMQVMEDCGYYVSLAVEELFSEAANRICADPFNTGGVEEELERAANDPKAPDLYDLGFGDD